MVGGTGRLEDRPDSRDLLWRSVALVGDLGLPPGFSRGSLGPVRDQGETSMCVAYSGATIKANHEYRQHRRYYPLDEPELYALCKERDGYPGVDGTTLRACGDSLRSVGIRALRNQALGWVRFKVASYVRLRELEEIKEAVLADGPVHLGLDIDTAWDRPALDGQLGPPTGDVLGGHAVVVYGWADKRRSLKIRNSWGPSWGYNGMAWLPYAHLEAYPTWDAWRVTDAEGWWERMRRGRGR